MSAALALAFSAGLVATINPCGFAMLPAYLSYFMGIQDEDRSRSAAVRTALVVGGVVSTGFLVVFGIAGIVIAAVSRSVATQWIPWLALAVGVGIVLLGIALLFGYQLTVGIPKAKRGRRGEGFGNVFGFGVSYAVASLSCTLPVFLTVVATQITQRSFVSGLTIFLAYAAGMATVLMALTVVLAIGKHSFVNWLRASVRYVNRVSGVVLVIAGAWIIWFWSTALASGAGALSDSATFGFIESLQASIVNFVADNTLLVAVLGIAIVLGAAAFVARVRSTHTRAGGSLTDGDQPDERSTVGVGDRDTTAD